MTDQATERADGADILSFDAVRKASVGHKFELMDPAGKPYPKPIELIVQGRQAEEVTKFYQKLVNDHISKNEMARRRGKTAEAKTAEQVFEDNINGAAVRAIGWVGITQSFDRGLLRDALRRNPHWIDQIVEESDDLGNF